MPHTHTGTLHSLRDQRGEYQYLNTIIEEADNNEASSSRPAMQTVQVAQQKRALWLSPASDHFPTPRGCHFLSAPILPSSPSTASMEGDDDEDYDLDSSPNSNASSSPWNGSGRASTEVTEFDDLYDATDDETYYRKPRQQHTSGVTRKHSIVRRSNSGRSAASSEESRRMLPQLTIPVRPAPAVAVAESDPKLATSPMPPTPSAQVVMSPAIVSFMQKHHSLAVPTASAPPSLDGSMTSDQMSQMSAQVSAPPTPIIEHADAAADATSGTPGGWAGVQLQPGALATLQSLSLSRSDAGSVHEDESDRVLELPASSVEEMTETRSQRPLRLLTSGLVSRNTVPFSPAQQRSLAGLTRLEIPSPGGFFSGLSPRSRHTWHMPGMTPVDSAVDSAPPPTSGTAEQFYRLPWNEGMSPPPPPPRRITLEDRPSRLANVQLSSTSPIEQVIEVAAPVKTEDDPLTAFRVQQTPVTAVLVPPPTPAVVLAAPPPAPSELSADSHTEEVVATEIVEDYHAIDSQKLQQLALSHLDRTEMWLVAQRAYLNGVTDLTESHDEMRSPRSPEVTSPQVPPPVPPKDEEVQTEVQTEAQTPEPAVAPSPPSRKKTVRFSEGLKSPPAAALAPRSLPLGLLVHQESAYYRAFTDCVVRSHRSDGFVHRQPRFEAVQAQRLLLRTSHRNQLLGKYQLTVVPQSAKKRMSANVVRGDDQLVDDPAKLRADKEADARSQMALATWHVHAMRLLSGGRLLLAPVDEKLATSRPNRRRERARVLDLGGQATCDWAWHVALQYPNAKVYSVTTKAIRQLSNANVRGPPNHRQVAVERLTRLPFADDQFDVVRAAELHTILKFVGEHGEDEWETCLRECYRVLKPGGYLEFSVLDADLVNAGPLANAKSVEFGFVLQTLGYDPTPTRLFLGRLDRVGFVQTRRAWTCLPVGPRNAVVGNGSNSPPRDSTAPPTTLSLEAMVSGSTDAVAAVAGLVGSVSWERWLLRAEMEKTAGELRLADTVTASAALHEAGKSLDGVHAIVEEGRKTGAAWRMLRGHARKPLPDSMGTINMMLDMSGLF